MLQKKGILKDAYKAKKADLESLEAQIKNVKEGYRTLRNNIEQYRRETITKTLINALDETPKTAHEISLAMNDELSSYEVAQNLRALSKGKSLYYLSSSVSNKIKIASGKTICKNMVEIDENGNIIPNTLRKMKVTLPCSYSYVKR